MSQTVNEARIALRVAESRFNELPANAHRAQVDYAIRQLNEARAEYNKAFEEERRRFLLRRTEG